jgi:hypothetical protein
MKHLDSCCSETTVSGSMSGATVRPRVSPARPGPWRTESAWIHSAYGLWIGADQPIPGLAAVTEPVAVDVHVVLGSIPSRLDEKWNAAQLWYASPRDGNTPPALRVWVHEPERFFQFEFAGGMEFVVDGEGTQVWARWLYPMTREDAAVYLLGPVLGFVLLLRGMLCLHASAVAVGGKALALVGPPGSGKSTAAAALVQRGHALMSEDVVTLVDHDGAFRVQPGYPAIRLWPASVQALYGAAQGLAPLSPNWDKRRLDLVAAGYSFQAHPLRLGAIYLLGARASGTRAPHVQVVRRREALQKLAANTYSNYLKDTDMRAQEFSLLARLVSDVPIRRIIPHENIDRLGALADLLLRDYRSLAENPHALEVG